MDTDKDMGLTERGESVGLGGGGKREKSKNNCNSINSNNNKKELVPQMTSFPNKQTNTKTPFLQITYNFRVPYFVVYDVYFFAHIFEGKLRMCILHG